MGSQGLREGAVHPQKATPLPVSLRDPVDRGSAQGVCTLQPTAVSGLVLGPQAAEHSNALHQRAGCVDPGTLVELCGSEGPGLWATKVGRLGKAGLMKGS